MICDCQVFTQNLACRMKKLISIRSVEIFGVARFLRETVGEGRSSIDIWEHWSRTRAERQQFMVLMGIGSLKMELEIDGQLIQSDVDDEIGFGVMADVDFKPKQGTQHKLMLDYFDKRLDVSDLGLHGVMTCFPRTISTTGPPVGSDLFQSKKRSIMIPPWNMTANWSGLVCFSEMAGPSRI